MRLHYRLLVALGALITVGLHTWLLMRYPLPFVDEAWNGSRAWGFVQTGKTFGMLDSGVIDRYDGYWTFLPWLSNVIQALALRVVGHPSLIALRVLSLLLGGILLLEIYIIARKLGGTTVAWISLALIAYSPPFWNSSHTARYDIFIAVGGFGAIALWFINDATPRWWLSFLCGLIAGLAVEMHSFAAVYLASMFCLFVQRDGLRTFRTPAFWWWIAGGALSFLFYVAMHLLPYPESYATLYKIYFGATHTPPLLNPQTIPDAFRQTIARIADYSFLSPLQLVALIVFAFKPIPGSKRLLAIIIPLLLSYVVLIKFKFGYYTIALSPPLEIGLALGFVWAAKHPPKLQMPMLWRAVLATFVVWWAVSGMQLVQTARMDTYADYKSTLAKMSTVIKPDDVIMGSPTFWYGFTDHTYYTIEQLVFYPRYEPGATVERTIAVLKPTIFIVDKHFNNHVFDTMPEDEYQKAWFIPRADVDAVLDDATLLTTFTTPIYGTIEIYRLAPN